MFLLYKLIKNLNKSNEEILKEHHEKILRQKKKRQAMDTCRKQNPPGNQGFG